MELSNMGHTDISFINVETTTYANVPEPLGILQLAGSLVKNNFNVKILDMTVDDRPIKQFLDADLIGLSFTSANTFKAESIIKQIREKNPNAKILVGGSHTTALPEKALQEMPVDIIAKRESDETIVEIAEGKKPLKDILGISYRDSRGKVHHNPYRPFIENLDSLPYPARHLVDMSKYDIHFTWEGRKPAATMFSSRGCFANCIYCASKVTWTRRVRFRSAEHVLGEIDHLREKYGTKEILFYDDVFPLNHERLIQVCKGLKDRDITWCCFSRVDTLVPGHAKVMAESGCHMINFGVESGSAKILQNLKKGLPKGMEQQKILEAFRECKKNKISTKASFMLGSPGETKDTINETINIIKKTMPDYMFIFSITPLPGTELWDMHQKSGMLSKDWTLYDQNLYDKYIDTDVSYDYVRKKILRTYLKYYLSPRYFLKQLKRGSFKPYKAMLDEFKGIMPYIMTGKTRKAPSQHEIEEKPEENPLKVVYS
jgi:anaerobic magnesium-protoporphyrin IX monomethyl ester cyclase